MPRSVGNIELYMGPHQIGGPDNLLEAIVNFIDGAQKRHAPRLRWRGGWCRAPVVTAGLLIMWLLVSAGPVQAGQPGQQAGGQNVPTAYLLWLVVAGAGMFGGFLFGIKDKTLTLPHRKSKYVIEPGFVGDCLFGLAGGFLVFILLPGNFEFNLAKPEEIIKIVAVAVVGGYGGRALVEKVLSQQFYELESDIAELRQQNKQGALAIALVRQHLDEDQDTPLIAEEELKQAILQASSSAKVEVFNMARTFRTTHYEHRPELLPRTIPIFQALIEDDREEQFHRNHGQLGYVYKDQRPQPQWKPAEAGLSKAIHIRDKLNEGGFLLYELNRAICNIQLGAELEVIRSDLDQVLRLGPDRGVWVRRPHPHKAQALVHWIHQNEGRLRDWLEENDIQAG